ncbi:MAG: hypothetical protein Q8L98_07785 [Chlamydiales bacterium]|nr:hypothetical protein [Chlamydiales bacterium]
MSRQFLTTDHYEEIRFSITSLSAGRVLRSDTLQLVLDDPENAKMWTDIMQKMDTVELLTPQNISCLSLVDKRKGFHRRIWELSSKQELTDQTFSKVVEDHQGTGRSHEQLIDRQ